MTKPRYTKTAPSKEGYYWIRLDGKPGDEICVWFIPYDGEFCHVASPHCNELLHWSELQNEGATRSVKEVRP